MGYKLVVFFLLSLKTVLGLTQSVTTILQATNEDFIKSILEYNNEVIIDVRDTASYENQIIHGAILVSTNEQLIQLIDTLDLDTPLLVYCSQGKRSQKACEELVMKGFKVVVNLKKGLINWPEKQYPLDKIHYK